MNLKTLLARPFASYIHKQVQKSSETALADQERIWKELVSGAKNTEFGKDHHFADIASQDAFKKAIPIRDYEMLAGYIEKVKEGKHNVLWKGKPIYFAKTSGTTSGTKYIPISRDSISNHINTARNALLCYMSESSNYHFSGGKMIFLSGSPILERVGGVPTGRLSGIVNHHIPKYLRTNQLPTYETNCVEDWEEKLDRILAETIDQNMTLISGIPPWMQMYFDRLMEKSGKPVGEIFPQLSVLVHGGVNFEPYKANLLHSIGRQLATIETYPASEGFLAFQDSQVHHGLLLNTNSGIYFEFVAADQIFEDQPKRLSLAEVELGVNYAIIINSNAGLWGYNIGDTVKFVSLNPYRIEVTGRIKHFISAFGEHVIGEEVEAAILQASNQFQCRIVEFTVAPFVATDGSKSYHEWFVEFEQAPDNMEAFAEALDNALREKNVYYDDLIGGNILQRLVMRPIVNKGFIQFMKAAGKLGGQNKVPRLSNDRTIADQLKAFLASS